MIHAFLAELRHQEEENEERDMANLIDVEPINDWLVVWSIPAPEQTAGGIVLPDCGKEKPMRGVVVAAGPGKRLENGERVPLSLKVADVIFHNKFAGASFVLGNVEFTTMRENEVYSRDTSPETSSDVAQCEETLASAGLLKK